MSNTGEVKPSKAVLLAEKIEKQRAKLDELVREKKRIDQRQKALETRKSRMEDVRRKILVGAMFLNKAENDDAASAALQTKLDEYLTRDDDRALFGLAAKQAL